MTQVVAVWLAEEAYCFLGLACGTKFSNDPSYGLSNLHGVSCRAVIVIDGYRSTRPSLIAMTVASWYVGTSQRQRLHQDEISLLDEARSSHESARMQTDSI